MPRRRVVQKREILPDPIYKDKLVAKFVNCLMIQGKKSVAESILYNSLDVVGERLKKESLEIFQKAVDNVRPVIEVKSRRVGGSTYQVPIEIRSERRTALAIKWIIKYANERAEKSMKEKLAAEIIEAFNKRGGAIKKREDTHKMAEANKAFAHFKW